MSLFAPLAMSTSLPAVSPFANVNGIGAAPAPLANDGTPSFSQMLQSALNDVNNLQLRSGEMNRAYAVGRTGDVHSVMMAGERATIALQMTAQIRNTAVEAYQEIMRISV